MLDVNKFSVLNDNVLVEAIREKERGGIIRGITSDDKPELGNVLKVGPGRTSDNGQFISTTIEPGMTVLFNQYTTTKFNFGGKDYYVLREEDIVAFM